MMIMKKLLIVASLTLLLVVLVRPVNAAAGPPDYSPYCIDMGYTVNGTNCLFGDGNKCNLESFYNGSCGSGYVKELSCVKEGQIISLGKYECCENLKAVSFSYVKNPDTGECEDIVGGTDSKCSACGDGICNSTNFENDCNCPEDCNESLTCASKGEFCGGIAGISCCGELVCDYEGNYPDAAGECVVRKVIICEDLCGDGECQEAACEGDDCPCPETFGNCPLDCKSRVGFFSNLFSNYSWTLLIIAAVVFVFVGLKILKWVFWSLAIIAIILAILFYVF